MGVDRSSEPGLDLEDFNRSRRGRNRGAELGQPAGRAWAPSLKGETRKPRWEDWRRWGRSCVACKKGPGPVEKPRPNLECFPLDPGL